MHELLRALDSGSRLLDLGCSTGSFDRSCTAATVIRLDRDPPRARIANFVQADAAQLPFRDSSFDAVIANHSLEHIAHLDAALAEVGRIINRSGALFVAVPDTSTLTDKIYRWLARGGGHINPFTSPTELAGRIERITGLRHAATRPLYSSLSFLNRRNSPRPRPWRLILLGGGLEGSLFLYAWLSRRVDRWLRMRTSLYGWALYFGNFGEPIDTTAWINVCIRCGSGSPASDLAREHRIQSVVYVFRVYRCPHCGAVNPFSD